MHRSRLLGSLQVFCGRQPSPVLRESCTLQQVLPSGVPILSLHRIVRLQTHRFEHWCRCPTFCSPHPLPAWRWLPLLTTHLTGHRGAFLSVASSLASCSSCAQALAFHPGTGWHPSATKRCPQLASSPLKLNGVPSATKLARPGSATVAQRHQKAGTATECLCLWLRWPQCC